MLQLYNTLTNKKEKFKPLHPGEVKMYNCGPTVYSRAHIGNFASYLMADLIRRYLEYLGYRVHQIKNITDVGHLVADADDGEDKMQKAAREEKKDPYEIARYYETIYLKDSQKLNILDAEQNPRATEHISEMIEMIEGLMQKGFAYETEDGVYFDIAKFPKYGKLSGNTLDKLQAGKRVDINENKKHPYDFALWKKIIGKNKDHIMQWDSPWGKGFPGWHIECSAMSRKYLGEQIDIHTGGEDNIFPHHECEIAQSEAFSGQPFTKYWIHKRWFFIDGEKMSKSLGNIYTVDDIERMGFSPLDLRYLFLSVHYRAKLNFTPKGLSDAKLNRAKMNNVVRQLQQIAQEKKEAGGEIVDKLILPTKQKFETAMNDDLNTSAALAVVFEFLKIINTKISQRELSAKEAKKTLDFLEKINYIFATFNFGLEDEIVPIEIQKLAQTRQEARKNNDFVAADKLRDELLAKGYEMRDERGGTYRVVKTNSVLSASHH
jgi:cysteinyl-tRNA synthetase